ncbi:MAG: bifunctional metallophosphatase/5'-nucleotidase [Clostridia bacterium]|nr:bifunctional metallophosphatase/5'-nucleotidase [Clostridia bacterium]
MKTKLTQLLSLLLALLVFCSIFALPSFADTEKNDITVLFTHDLHSHFLPGTDENGKQYGGYARLATAINEQKQKHPNAILVDGGDFSMGSLFQTAFATSATELRLMGAMGYDVTTFGNHEFDYLPKGLLDMLSAAKNSSDVLPQIVIANYKPKADDTAMQNAFDDFGVKDYTVIERGGVYFAIFGMFGLDSDDCAPNSNMEFLDPVTTAQKTVDEAIKFCKDTYSAEPVVVCLSHSGTSGGEGEDYELAKAVNGIDIIVSGHTHTTLTEPIKVNNTFIVSAGEYATNLGVISLAPNADSSFDLKDYKLIPINDTITPDEKIAKLIEDYKKNVEQDYLAQYSLSFDEILTTNPYEFESVDDVYATQHESTLCNIFSDAYKWSVEKATGESVDMALTAAGVIRDSLPKGAVSVSDVFSAASLGVGTEGELVAVYLTGRDLKNALEVDASVQPIMKAAQLFCSGVEYSFNTSRMIFNKVDYARLRRNDGTLEEIDDEKLYKIVTGMYCGQMLGSVKEKSFGLLEIVPRDKNGNPIESEDLVNYVVRDKNGTPLKEWYAISDYLKNMGDSIDSKYAAPDNRKVVYSSLSPADLVRNANKFTFIVMALIVIIIAVIVVITLAVVRKIKKKKAAK